MDAAPPADPSLLASARRAGTSVLDLLRTRADILSVELQEEKLRVLSLAVPLAVALSLAMAGILLAIGILALFLWRQFGYAGPTALALVVLGAAAVIVWQIRRRILAGPRPFAATIAEIRKDIECLRPRD